MGLFGGIIAGALEGGAKAAYDVADTRIKTDAAKELSKYSSDLETERQQGLLRLRAAIENKQKLAEVKGPLADAKLEYDVNRTKRVGGAETEVLGSREGVIQKARTDAEIAATNDPKYLSGQTKLARARHIESAASAAQARLAEMEIGDKLEARKQVALYADESADPKVRETAGRWLTAKGILKPNEFDLVKVTTEEQDPNNPGKTIKSERTERRVTGGKGAPTGNDPLGLRQGAPAATNAPAAPAKTPVPGRPLYWTPVKDLQATAKKPRGVSSSEAAEAQAELDRRIGEDRIQ